MLGGRGILGGDTVLTEAEFAEWVRPVSGGRAAPRTDRGSFIGYGAGWILEYYDGEFTVSHSGVVEGFSSDLIAMPFKGLAVVVLSNRYGNPVPTILSRYVLDHLTGRPPAPWQARYASIRAQQRADRPGDAATPSDPIPGDAVSIAGRYEHPAYGTLTIESPTSTGAWGSFGGRRYHLGHRRALLFDVREPDAPSPEAGRLRIGLDSELRPVAAWWEMDDSGPIEFLRVGDHDRLP